MNLNSLSTVRMTASRAAQLFSTALLITARDLTEQHLDMLQVAALDRQTQMDIGDAQDAIRAGDHRHPAVARCVAAYNALASKR